MLNLTDIQNKWDLSSNAHQDEIDKCVLIDVWYSAFEKHLKLGESYNESYRFPELFGAIRRKYDNLVEFFPNMRAKGDGDGIIAIQSAYDHQVSISNLAREKNRANFDAVKYGWGVIFVAPVRYERKVKDEGKKLFYDGLGAERIDIRDFIPAYSANLLHDHTGREYCPYVFRRRVYYKDSFLARYEGLEGFKIDMNKIGTTTYDGGFTGSRSLTQRESVEKQDGDYVCVLEYWNQDTDDLVIFANSFDNIIYESPVGIPYSHKQLPFHIYYNYRREDSIFGLGEVEINMPYSLFRETVLDLMIKNAKLELQPAHFISGDIDFDSEENELEPGAIFTVNGVTNGRLADSIVPFRAGGIGQDVFAVVSQIENSRIAVTGDDTTSLYANPNQLATQTNAKKEASQKGIRSNIIRNADETEWYLANQIISYLKNELALPYMNEKKKKVFRKVKIQGYQAIQNKKDSPVKFEKAYGANSEYFLNKKVAEEFEDCEIEVVNDKLDEVLKADKLEKMGVVFGQIAELAQVSPQLIQSMDFTEYLKENMRLLSFDIHKIFPALDKKAEAFDEINIEHDQIAYGIVPEIKPDEDSREHLEEHLEFGKSAIFKKLSKKAQKAYYSHIQLTLTNVGKQIESGYKPIAGATNPQPTGMGQSAPAMLQSGVQGMATPPQAPNGTSNGGIPTPADATGF